MAHHRSRQRVAFDPTTSTLDDQFESLLSEPVSPLTPINPLEQAKDLVGVQDLRRFDPTDAVPQDLVGRIANVGQPLTELIGRTREFMEFPERLARRQVSLDNYFQRPREALECARRKIRKEVMFAQPERARRKGSGGGRRRDEFSDIKC